MSFQITDKISAKIPFCKIQIVCPCEIVNLSPLTVSVDSRPHDKPIRIEYEDIVTREPATWVAGCLTECKTNQNTMTDDNLVENDIQSNQFAFGQDLQNTHGFKTSTLSQVNLNLDSHDFLSHKTMYQKTCRLQDSDTVCYIDCVVSVPLDDITRISVDFTLQFESKTGTMNLNNFFITNGNFTQIDISAIVNQLLEIASIYS